MTHFDAQEGEVEPYWFKWVRDNMPAEVLAEFRAAMDRQAQDYSTLQAKLVEVEAANAHFREAHRIISEQWQEAVNERDEALAELARENVSRIGWRDAYHEEARRRERAENELARLRAIVAEVGSSGVEFEDARVGYVVVQVSRETWEQCKAEAAGTCESELARLRAYVGGRPCENPTRKCDRCGFEWNAPHGTPHIVHDNFCGLIKAQDCGTCPPCVARAAKEGV